MSVDYPRAWQIARASDEHVPACSFRVTGGALLCDCDVLWDHPEFLDDAMHGAR